MLLNLSMDAYSTAKSYIKTTEEGQGRVSDYSSAAPGTTRQLCIIYAVALSPGNSCSN